MAAYVVEACLGTAPARRARRCIVEDNAQGWRRGARCWSGRPGRRVGCLAQTVAPGHGTAACRGAAARRPCGAWASPAATPPTWRRHLGVWGLEFGGPPDRLASRWCAPARCAAPGRPGAMLRAARWPARAVPDLIDGGLDRAGLGICRSGRHETIPQTHDTRARWLPRRYTDFTILPAARIRGLPPQPGPPRNSP